MKQIIKKGDRFGRLTAVRFDEMKSNQYWMFKCECGIEKIIRAGNVKSGHTKSCGCLWKIHGMKETKIYKIWTGMKERCLNEDNPAYKNYGGRGITICSEWLNSFQNFYSDMGDRPQGKSLDRIKNNYGRHQDNRQTI